ncbi:hypothetical protein [Paenibacillus cremeus]|uniref:Uncharacterized protein n=1 Tax=Paenibacillus cremeus TaxID=2163881 RepID=A0A559KEF4_9BACL|nr:hypothetical protein [Paenibacillus cremeus]TVY10499.1 hypothetical protein FPZ49_07110 [Paenibacillus cremeus]
MSIYDEFVREKEAVDRILSSGFAIRGLRESLDGTEVRFSKDKNVEQEVLLLLNADARKYVTTLIFTQQLRQAKAFIPLSDDGDGEAETASTAE